MNLILVTLLAASAASQASKDYLATEPMLAGSLITFCEKDAPKSCKKLDRRDEAITGDPALMSGQMALKLKKIAPEFHSLAVEFIKSDKVPNSLDLQLKFFQDSKKNQ